MFAEVEEFPLGDIFGKGQKQKQRHGIKEEKRNKIDCLFYRDVGYGRG